MLSQSGSYSNEWASVKGRSDVDERETIESVKSGRDELGGKREVCVRTEGGDCRSECESTTS